jgi:ribonuclease Z
MVPTAKRNHSGILVRYRDEGILFDCGEGIQRQLRIAGISPTKITRIIISHWHGDHVLGIPGLIQSLAANHYNRTLEIYGPVGTKDFMKKILNAFICEDKISLNVTDISSKKVLETEHFKIESKKLKHSAETLGYCFIEKDKPKINTRYLAKFGLGPDPILKKLKEKKDIVWEGKKIRWQDATTSIKGKKICFINDTALCKACSILAKDSDILICESTFGKEFEEKAANYQHLTSTQAASIAKESNVKRLILTHFSQRYKSVRKLVNEAKKIFPETEAAKDFLKISL